jgi:hypothetical protein
VHDIRAEAAHWPLHGVDGWVGPRLLGTWEREDQVLTTVGLNHGDHTTAYPYVNVLVTAVDPAMLVAQLRVLSLVAATGTFADVVPKLTEPPARHLQLCVEGRPHRAAAWAEGDTWFATVPVGWHTIVVEARTVSPTWINLVPVRDVGPYLTGREALLRRWRRAS